MYNTNFVVRYRDIENELNNINYTFHEGGKVYVEKDGSIVVANILKINLDETYLIEYLDKSTDIKFKTDLFIYLPCNKCDLIVGRNNIDFRSILTTDFPIDTCLDSAYLFLKSQI